MENTRHFDAEEATLSSLMECLLKERDCLVLFKTQKLIANNGEKERLCHELSRIREIRRETTQDSFLATLRPEWAKLCHEVNLLCASNLRLIERSLARQSTLLENLRKLMSGPPIYSHRGDSVSGKYEGRVVEGFY